MIFLTVNFLRLNTLRLLTSIIVICFVLACGSGGTDGGEPEAGAQFVADGGAGGSISISIGDSLAVTETTSFFVSLRDAGGAPLSFVTVTCESERGIAIIEPSLNGIAQESTGSSGTMSGKLGGLLPGSYLLECRGPQGFGLIARTTIVISGTVPDGFAGFPGSAGGNLGGGQVIDQTPIPGVDSDAVVVSSSSFTDAGGTSPFGAPIDTVRDLDCANDGNTTTTDIEPFLFVNYGIVVSNNSNLRIFIDSVSINVLDGQAASSTGTQSKNVEIAPRSNGPVTGLFIDHPNYVAGSQTQNGTFDAIITVTFTTEEGDTFSVTDRTSVSLAGVDNC